MTNERIGSQSTRTPKFISDLADRSASATNNRARGLGEERSNGTGIVGQNTTGQQPVNTTNVADIRPSGTATNLGAVNSAGAGSAALRTAQQQTVTDAAYGVKREEYAQDINDNTMLVKALGIANLHPTPEGLIRVEQAINKNPQAWNELSEAAKAVLATGGASAAANKALGTAMQKFSQAAGLRKTDTADLAYMMARVMMKQDETERDDSVKRLQAALAAAEARLKSQQEERAKLGDKEAAPAVVPPQQSDGGKKDDGGSQTNNTAAVADEVARRNTERAQLDSQIENTKALIADLQAQIQEANAGMNKEGSNQDLVTEAILAMVEQAHALAQLTDADMIEDPNPAGGTGNGGGSGSGNNGGTGGTGGTGGGNNKPVRPLP